MLSYPIPVPVSLRASFSSSSSHSAHLHLTATSLLETAGAAGSGIRITWSAMWSASCSSGSLTAPTASFGCTRMRPKS